MRRHDCSMAKRFDPYDFIIRLDAQILGIEPVICRMLELPRDLNFAQLHEVLQAAIANAENNHQLDVDRLVVSEATVGKAFVMKRFRARARGRVGKIQKPFSNLTVVVREVEEEA